MRVGGFDPVIWSRELLYEDPAPDENETYGMPGPWWLEDDAESPECAD